MAGRRSTAHRSRRAAPVYKWTGLQAGNTAITTGGVAFVIVSGVEIERYGRCTLERIVGHLTFRMTDSDAGTGPSRVAVKVMKLAINDAATLTGDDQAIDTDEEDIAKRQLWSYFSTMEPETASYFDVRPIEIDIRVRVKLLHPKEEVILLTDVSVNNRVLMDVNLRALLRLP